MNTINFINMDFVLQLICGMVCVITGLVFHAFSSWLKKFMEAFLTAVIGDPKKLGERAGRWVRSRNSSDGDGVRVRERYKHRAVRKVFCCFCCAFRSQTRLIYETPTQEEGTLTPPLHSDRVLSSHVWLFNTHRKKIFWVK